MTYEPSPSHIPGVVSQIEEDNENIILNKKDKGLSCNDWQSEDLVTCEDNNSDTTGDEISRCGPFETCFMPKFMSDYKWEIGTTFIDKI